MIAAFIEWLGLTLILRGIRLLRPCGAVDLIRWRVKDYMEFRILQERELRDREKENGTL